MNLKAIVKRFSNSMTFESPHSAQAKRQKCNFHTFSCLWTFIHPLLTDLWLHGILFTMSISFGMLFQFIKCVWPILLYEILLASRGTQKAHHGKSLILKKQMWQHNLDCLKAQFKYTVWEPWGDFLRAHGGPLFPCGGPSVDLLQRWKASSK